VTSGAAGWRKSGPTAQLAKSTEAAKAVVLAKSHLIATPDIGNGIIARELKRGSTPLFPISPMLAVLV
jgi:hypothetical protein